MSEKAVVKVEDKKEKKKKFKPAKLGEVSSKFIMECLESNELGDGMLYAALHKDVFIFAKNFDCWFAWDGHSWIADELDWAIAAVENVALRYSAEIPEMWKKYGEEIAQEDGGNSKAIRYKINSIGKRIDRLRNDTGRKNCLKFAHTNPVNALAIVGHEFNKNPWLLACPNGVVDLRTGELEPGRPDDYISKKCSVDFPTCDLLDSKCDLFSKTLREIYGDNEEEIAYMQRLYGFACTGVTDRDHVFPVLIGRGRNGKSLIIETIARLLGDYAGPVPSEMLLDGSRAQAGGSDPSLMELKGLRLAIASETDEGRRFSSAKVKWLTGGDKISARGLYDKKLTNFEPTHTLVLVTNHEPTPPATDFAFWNRCWLVRHKFSFVDPKEQGRELLENERERDPKLKEKLRDPELGGHILAWLVKGCLAWQDQGLNPPDSVKKTTTEYQEEENYIAQFVEACCVVGKTERIGATDLYTAFKHWYQETINSTERFIPAQKKFGKQFREADLFSRRRTGGYYFYYGLTVTSTYQAIIDQNNDE